MAEKLSDKIRRAYNDLNDEAMWAALRHVDALEIMASRGVVVKCDEYARLLDADRRLKRMEETADAVSQDREWRKWNTVKE